MLMVVGLILIAANALIATYLIIWVTRVNKVSSDLWNEQYPTLIPIATACFAIGFVA